MSKVTILLKWDALVVSLMSIVYGIQLIASPQLLNGYAAYEVFSYLFYSKTLGIRNVIYPHFVNLKE